MISNERRNPCAAVRCSSAAERQRRHEQSIAGTVKYDASTKSFRSSSRAAIENRNGLETVRCSGQRRAIWCGSADTPLSSFRTLSLVVVSGKRAVFRALRPSFTEDLKETGEPR